MLPLQQAIAATLDGYARFGDTLSELGADELSRQTRLTDWAVRDLAAHVARVQAMQADAVRKAVAGQQELGGADEVPADADAQTLAEAVHAGYDALEAALADVTELDPTTPVVIPAGTLPLPGALTLFVVEAGLHASDLAHALGHPAELAAVETQACVTLLRPLLGLAAGNGTTPPPQTSIQLTGESFAECWAVHGSAWAPSEEEAGTVVSGSDEAVALFAYGRIGHDDERLRVDGDESVATRFKEFFPGP